MEADQKQNVWNWNIVTAKIWLPKLPLWITLDNYRLQKMYQQKVETNKDEFKFKNQKKNMLIGIMNQGLTDNFSILSNGKGK